MNLVEQSTLIVELIANHQTAIPKLEQTQHRVLTEKDLQVLEKLQQLEDLKLQDATTRANVAQLPKEIRDMDVATLENHIQGLETQIRAHRRVVQDAIASSAILNAIHHGQNTTFRESSLFPLLALRDDKAAETSYAVQMAQKLQRRLDKLVAENRRALTAQRVIVREIERESELLGGLDGGNNEDTVSELKTELEVVKNKRRVLSEIFTALITASGVDWASDSELVRLIVGFGELNKD